MGYKLDHLNQKELIYKDVLSDSAHPVSRCVIPKKSSHDADRMIYVKEYPDRTNVEEEVTFSALYRLDIGKHAATNAFLDDNEKAKKGVVSHALPQFIDYRHLFKRKQLAVRQTIFDSDNFKRPTSIHCVKGLADILMSAWLYGEDDLHRGNIGIAHDERGAPYWARLDFGMSFSSITQESRVFRTDIANYNAITLEGLQHFPDLGNYAPFYWPTSITFKNNLFNVRGRHKGNAYFERDKHYFSLLKTDVDSEAAKTFQEEKYAFLYKLFLNNIEDKKKLILFNVSNSEHANRLANQIENRILTMQWTALCDSGFQQYVMGMGKSKQTALMEEVRQNHKAVLDETLSDGFLHRKIEELTMQVDKIQSASSAQPSHTDIIESIFYQDVEIESLLSKAPIDEEAVHLKRMGLLENQTRILNFYLGSGRINEGLKELNFIIYRRSALAPITQLVSKLDDNVALRHYFSSLRKNRIIPALKALNGMRSDAIYQHELPQRLRHIESLMQKAIETDSLKGLLDSLPNLALKEKNEGIVTAIEEAKKIETALLSYQYKKILAPFSHRLDSIEKGNETVLTLSAHHINKIQHKCLSAYLSNCLDMKMSIADIDKSPMVVSLKQLSCIFNDVLTEELLISQAYAPFFERDLVRIKRIIEKYHLDNLFVQKHLEIEHVEQVTKAIQEMELVITRLALDLQREAFRSQEGSLEKHLYHPLLKASYQLSKALSKPDYHDTLEMQEVSHAGYLGAMLMKSPSIENGKACIEHARHLGMSHQRRMKTKVAFALAMLGCVVVVAAISALCWPAGIGIGLSIAAWCAFGAGGSAGMLSGAYAAKRFFRDKDKVKRKLDDMGGSITPLTTHSYSPEGRD